MKGNKKNVWHNFFLKRYRNDITHDWLSPWHWVYHTIICFCNCISSFVRCPRWRWPAAVCLQWSTSWTACLAAAATAAGWRPTWRRRRLQPSASSSVSLRRATATWGRWRAVAASSRRSRSAARSGRETWVPATRGSRPLLRASPPASACFPGLHPASRDFPRFPEPVGRCTTISGCQRKGLGWRWYIPSAVGAGSYLNMCQIPKSRFVYMSNTKTIADLIWDLLFITMIWIEYRDHYKMIFIWDWPLCVRVNTTSDHLARPLCWCDCSEVSVSDDVSCSSGNQRWQDPLLLSALLPRQGEGLHAKKQTYVHWTWWYERDAKKLFSYCGHNAVCPSLCAICICSYVITTSGLAMNGLWPYDNSILTKLSIIWQWLLMKVEKQCLRVRRCDGCCTAVVIVLYRRSDPAAPRGRVAHWRP